ncbi:histidine kinase [Teredinibacter haidensis]|uniref:histidine kinase n=1 Tax=Teredinibacter haidensis TaxID=2731755 RepID=UPI00163BE5A6|nr:histidine kinase [Teredinibacter haidensis]
MKIFAKVMLFALISNSVIAGEVGALDPEISKAASYDVALVEIGASDRWETRSDNVAPVESASSRQMKRMNAHLDTINATMNIELDKLVEKKLEITLP